MVVLIWVISVVGLYTISLLVLRYCSLTDFLASRFELYIELIAVFAFAVFGAFLGIPFRKRYGMLVASIAFTALVVGITTTSKDPPLGGRCATLNYHQSENN